ncbi:hypothetical protein [Pelagicoccus sp. SDUM812002]|uniref:hypothetical protein n=1 Tax=Pelagicoccus sp. SDUM812002 TaxID=3041266 RepID=UPI002810131D|nr:hypothetical protein [Pelagicoccus sp. SDUM812002]MDQ8188358.1 hypothetical protein [Pelagicoccus sp. SDUM812002]
MARIEISGIQCVDETGGGREAGKDEIAFCIAAFGVDAATYSEFRRFETRLSTGLDDGDSPRFATDIRFNARSREDGRPSWPLRHLEFHVAAYELDGSEDTEVAARRVYERWRVALAEHYTPGLRTDVDRTDFDGDRGSATQGLRIAYDQRGSHQLVMLDAWRIDLTDPRSDSFGAPGVGQSNGLYVGPSHHGIHRSINGVQRWRNDNRTSERRIFGSTAAKSTYSFYVNYYDS